jgi:hypothetical protein
VNYYYINKSRFFSKRCTARVKYTREFDLKFKVKLRTGRELDTSSYITPHISQVLIFTMYTGKI